MPIALAVPDDVLELLREVFTAVEGDCEPWTDAEVVRRTLIRGAMAYAQSGGGDFAAASALARRLRAALDDA